MRASAHFHTAPRAGTLLNPDSGFSVRTSASNQRTLATQAPTQTNGFNRNAAAKSNLVSAASVRVLPQNGHGTPVISRIGQVGMGRCKSSATRAIPIKQNNSNRE